MQTLGKIIKGILGIIAGVFLLSLFMGLCRVATTDPHADPGTETKSASASIVDALVDPQMDSLHDKVYRDSIEQYEALKQAGISNKNDRITLCTYAGMVVAAAVQAKDTEAIKKWKAIEKKDCRKAGMPFH